jgi:hypothetical protein
MRPPLSKLLLLLKPPLKLLVVSPEGQPAVAALLWNLLAKLLKLVPSLLTAVRLPRTLLPKLPRWRLLRSKPAHKSKHYVSGGFSNSSKGRCTKLL